MSEVQFREDFFPLGIVLPQYRTFIHLRDNTFNPTRLNSLAVFIKILTPDFESPSRLEYSFEVAQVSFQNQHLECSQIVQKPSNEHHMLQIPVIQILVKIVGIIIRNTI